MGEYPVGDLGIEVRQRLLRDAALAPRTSRSSNRSEGDAASSAAGEVNPPPAVSGHNKDKTYDGPSEV